MRPRLTMRGILPLLVAGCLGFGSTGTPASAQADLSAQIAAEAEARARQIDAQAQPRQTGPGVLADPMGRAELPPPGGPTVLLRSVVFAPSSAFLGTAELDAIRARYEGQRVDFRGIAMLLRDVNDLYAEKGVVTAAAVLQPQDIESGTLTVTLVEGQVGVVAVVGEPQTLPDYLFDRVRFARGTTVDVPAASEDIAFFNRTNRAQVRLLLQPGAAFGLTDLLFGVTEPPPHQLQVFFDNNGVASTGRFRGSVIYRRYGFIGRDDTFLAYLEASEGSVAGTARYDFPVTTRGTRLAFTYTSSDIRVVSGPTLPLDIDGWSGSGTVALSQPFVANDRWLVQGTLSAFRGHSASFSAGVPVVNAVTLKHSAGLSLAYSGESGNFTTQAQAIRARVDDRIAATRTSYTLAAGSYDANYAFGNGLLFVGRGAWQWSRANLLPGSLLFQIGGPTSVRGYPSDGVAGDRGYFTNFELHRRFENAPRPASGFVFVDYGEVYSTFPKVTSMASVGLGAAYDLSPNARLEMTAAFPVRRAVANQSRATLPVTLTVSQF